MQPISFNIPVMCESSDIVKTINKLLLSVNFNNNKDRNSFEVDN